MHTSPNDYRLINLQPAVEHISNYAIFALDLSGKITTWNEGAKRLYGWKKKEIIGKGADILYEGDIRERQVGGKYFKTSLQEKIFEAEVYQRKKNSQPFLAAITICPFIDPLTDKTAGYLEIVKDITARNKREEEQISDNDLLRTEIERRNRIEEQLNLSNQELDAFASAASHDLQEPLRMVVSYLQLIERRYGTMFDQDGKDFLHFAIDGAERMKALISDLVEYSRIEKLGKALEKVDAGEVLQRVLHNMEVIIEENQAEITYDPLPEVWSDPVQLSVRLPI